MARWLIQLEGESFDLVEFPRWFPDGDAYAVEENGKVYITGPTLEDCSEASQVYEAAHQIIDEFSAVIALLWPSLRRPSIGHVIREGDDGSRRSYAFASASATGRSKARFVATIDGVQQDQKRRTQAQELLAGSHVDAHLREAVSMWGDPMRTWPRLYRILEDIEKYLGQKVHEAEFCSKDQRERFTRSANSAEVAGKDARHAAGKYKPPKNPLNLADGVSFVSGLLQSALQRAAEDDQGASSEV